MKQIQFSIKTRFNLFLAVNLLAFLITTIFFGLSVKKILDNRNYSQEIDKIQIQYLSLKANENSFMVKYPEDIVFFKTNENKYIRRFETDFNSISKNIITLNENPISEKLNLNQNIYLVKDYLENYNNIFHSLTKKIYERGSAETGVIGEMKVNIQSAIQNCNNGILLQFIDKLRKAENQYLYTRDAAYYQDFIKTFSLLNDFINTANPKLLYNLNDTSTVDTIKYIDIRAIIPQIQPGFIKNMNNYKRHFTTLVRLDNEIGLTSEQGIKADLAAEIAKIEPELDNINKIISQEKDNSISQIINSLIIFGIILIIIIIYAVLRFSGTIIRPIEKLKAYIEPLSKGQLPDKHLELKTKDELFLMNSAINELIEGLKKTTSFASTIGKGVFNTEFSPLSDKDVLGNSLLEMRKNLHQAQMEEEKRKYEDSLRKWANEGLAKFGEILRQSTNNINDLASNVIKNLVSFLEANQGGLFLYNDNDKADIHLELIASYAYNKERKKKKKIYLGEGLVGTCAIEKATIHMVEIPKDYLKITSGLGGANPQSLIIVPLKVEEQIFGVIEIASFKDFGKHEIEFVEKVSETIASTLSIAKINQRTAELLEQSQKQAEEMASQEEEMRQNLEELQATQDESARREAEMQSLINAINSSSLVVEFDLQGKIINVNQAILDLLQLTREQMIGRYQGDFDDMDEDHIRSDNFWNRLRQGELVTDTHKITVAGNVYWLHEVYTPILDADGFPYKILNLATDITSAKLQEEELREQAQKLALQEEILRKNVDALMETQEQMKKQQEELELANSKMLASDQILRKSLEKSKEQEKILQEKNIELASREAELKQNMEELEKVHKEIQSKQEEIEEANFQLKAGEIMLRKALEETKENERKVKEKNMQLAASEEELRQNMEELQATQEQLQKQQEALENSNKELARREAEMAGRLYAINQTNLVAEYNLDGTIIRINEKYCDILEYSEQDLVGRNQKVILDNEEKKSEEFKLFWKNLKNKQYQEKEFKYITRTGKEIFVKSIFNPILDDTGNPYKILEVGQDYTETKLQKAELEGRINSINKTNIMIEFDMNGTITFANKLFSKLFGYTENEINGKNHKFILDEEYKASDEYQEMWSDLRNGHIFESELKYINKEKETIYLQGVYSPMFDLNNKPYKVSFLGSDITVRKLQEESLKLQAREMAAQEEELRQNLEVLMTTQEEMENKQNQLERSEKALKEAYEKTQEQEQILREKNQKLSDNEEELKRNMENLLATQEQMQQQMQELQFTKARLEANEAVLKKAMQKAREQEIEQKAKIQLFEEKQIILKDIINELRTKQFDLLKKAQQQIQLSENQKQAFEKLVKDLSDKWNEHLNKIE